MPERSLKSLRVLAEAFAAFQRLSRAQLNDLGLTSSQFDIVATLGNTPGMSFKDLGEKSLITKGTLTGVVDRLERDGIVERLGGQPDGRSVLVRLTPGGDSLFKRTFPAVVESTRQAFSGLSAAELDLLDDLLVRLRASFDQHEPLAAQTVLAACRHPEAS